jgi:hypothetical protein
VPQVGPLRMDDGEVVDGRLHVHSRYEQRFEGYVVK